MSAIWPNFFIVGAAKAGTKSLYRYLAQHPQVFMSPIKEPRFFSRPREVEKFTNAAPISTQPAYLQLFEHADAALAIGEASPNYLWDSESPYRIRDKVPAAKIIISLRDPIERAYSQYLHFVRLGVEPAPFYEALAGPCRENYIGPSQYFDQVSRYFEVFGRGQILILMFEDLKREPLQLLDRVAVFLGVDSESTRNITVDTVYNPYVAPRGRLFQLLLNYTVQFRYHILRHVVPKSIRTNIYEAVFVKQAKKPPLDDRAKAHLKSIFADEIIELEKLLGIPLPDLRKGW